MAAAGRASARSSGWRGESQDRPALCGQQRWSAGWSSTGNEDQLSYVIIGQVCERVRAQRFDGYGVAWANLMANHAEIETWLVGEGLRVVKLDDLLTRRGRGGVERHAD
ncbi:MAG: hypothetical protein M3396_10610 [Actinomycetota bacterium]|nr:hypothetical protein [Actinomycetota bacterium]